MRAKRTVGLITLEFSPGMEIKRHLARQEVCMMDNAEVRSLRSREEKVSLRQPMDW